MKIKVLSDNRIQDQSFKKEHGLCIYLETENYKCLLDTGASDLFLDNADLMKVNIVDIDYVFISHGHADHTGGLNAFLQQNTKAKIIISENALTQKFFSTRKGMKDISANVDYKPYINRFIFVETYTVLEEEIHVFPCNSRHFPMPKANKTLLKDTGEELIIDDFNHELIISFGKKEQVVFTGCTHCGILNILESVKKTVKKPVSTLIGGFHLLYDSNGEYETENEIMEIADEILTEYPETTFYTGHCTGDNAYSIIKQKLDTKLNWFYAGFETTLN